MASLLVVGSMIIAAQVNAEGLSEAQKSKLQSEIEAEVKKVVTAANAADIDQVMASSSASPDYRCADSGTVYASSAAVLAVYREGFSNLRSQDIRLTEQHTQVLGPDLAIYTARGTFTSTDKSGTTTPRTPFAWTILWRRESGAWRQLNVHQSFGRPGTP